MKATKSALLVGVGGQGAILTAKVLVNGLDARRAMTSKCPRCTV